MRHTHTPRRSRVSFLKELGVRMWRCTSWCEPSKTNIYICRRSLYSEGKFEACWRIWIASWKLMYSTILHVWLSSPDAVAAVNVSDNCLAKSWILVAWPVITCARYPTLRRVMTLELARPLLKKELVCCMYHVPGSCFSLGSRRSCSRLRCRRLTITTHHEPTYHIKTSHHNSSQIITPYHIPSHHSSDSHTSLITAPLLVTTNHSSTSNRSTSHHNSSQLITTQSWQFHFSHLTYHITTSYHNSSQLITSQLITAPLLTPILTPHLTYHIRTHHGSTSHTSLNL